MRAMRIAAAALAAAGTFGVTQGHAEDAAACAPDRVVAMVEGDPFVFTVEIADTPAERALGLMHREELAADAGMIFLYPTERQLNFWMKNTPLPLDIIFFDAAGKVINIAAETEPFSLETLPSLGPAFGVLEINGGLAAELGIAPGTYLRHPAFAETAPEELRC